MIKPLYQPLQAAIAAIALLAVAPFAAAETIAPKVKDVSISQDLQKKIDKDYGAEEAAVLKKDLQLIVDRCLSQTGQTKVAWVSLTIRDAKPNKPTFEQLSKNTSLSLSDSIGVGGAKIEATLYDASGAVLGSVTHSWFSASLYEVPWASSTWSDASRAFSGAAYKIRQEAERDI